MPNRKKKFSLNYLTIRTFIAFWLAFFAMMVSLFLLPYLDNRFYSTLQEPEIASYQKKLVESIRNHKIKSLLSEVPLLPIDRFSETRPVIYNPQRKEFLGAFSEEKIFIERFAETANNFSHPMRKAFVNIQIAGPFQVYVDSFDEPFSLFFISHASPSQEILRYMIDNPLVLLILTLLTTTPLLWWFTYTIVKPIYRLQKAANNVALGNFKIDPQLSKDGPWELRQVGQSFNRMATAINSLVSNQQNLLSSISHEMKTPLTRLQLAVALVRHKTGSNSTVQRIEKEITRMDKMINELLLLSRQQMNTQTKSAIFPAEKIWRDVVQDAMFEAKQGHIEFEQCFQLSDSEPFLNGDPELLQSAVENIVRNALKYTKSKIKLNIFVQEETLKIRIDDNGFGVSPDEFEKIFQPFYRVDEARTRSTGGTGLGLTIVLNIIKEHQGKVWAEKSELGGLAVTIELPLWLNK
ncbi:envelope stress sensor histidine kinase CpxA [Rodentibacter caecimuris]|uniref:envelope stress sensor histidine kinase CpxA n=1 Tax=Rodentibacter caecimuris TaxID=1796644 RepID=UPI001094E1EF|nr:envelope stress sensor histidine kinase CpxA [Pasteurella caecimuris]TGY50537.1 envelope stress sensor histidine kinase CpxA [Pasteurella caecimuris]